MPTKTLLFYDIETTGLNKCFDQVLQFAAIRTDLQLKEIDRCEIQIKLNPDVIPAPQAVITHRIGIDAMQQGISEVEGMRRIHALLNTPGTISLGYNTLGFDDEFLRFGFYRNLLPPYTHQFSNQCSRMDIYPMAILYRLFKPEALVVWPEVNGRTSFKLEHISQANQLAQGPAHNAMIDVEATLALAKKFFQEKEMWDFTCGYFQKNIDLERLQQLPFSLTIAEHQFQEGLLISGSLGRSNNYQSLVMSLGQHQHYRNQTLWLRLDDADLTKTTKETKETIAEYTYVIRKRPAEQPIILHPKERFLKNLSEERRALTDQNRLWLQKNPELMKAICAYHQNYKYPAVNHVDAEALLYDTGFPPPFEEKLYRQFHEASPEKKEAIAERFADPLRRELAMRLLARHYPLALSAENQQFYRQFQQQILSEHPPVNYRNEKHLTREQALHDINLLKEKPLDTQQKQLLIDLESYLNAYAPLQEAWG